MPLKLAAIPGSRSKLCQMRQHSVQLRCLFLGADSYWRNCQVPQNHILIGPSAVVQSDEGTFPNTADTRLHNVCPYCSQTIKQLCPRCNQTLKASLSILQSNIYGIFAHTAVGLEWKAAHNAVKHFGDLCPSCSQRFRGSMPILQSNLDGKAAHTAVRH